MKSYFAALILSLGLIQSSTPPGTIEGRVLRAGTGEPIPNTPVTLISTGSLSEQGLASLLDQISQLVTIGLQGGGGGGSQDITIRQVASVLQSAGPGVSNQASVLTDRAGHFSFADLQQGRYTVWVQRFNYFGPLLNGVPTATASATITLDPAKPPPAVDLFMTQGLAISGRILDGRGQPASGMTATAYRATISDGRLTWSPVLSRPIDDRGEYRISPLPPGNYYVGVTPNPNAPTPPGQNPSVRTFFPGVTEPSDATKLVLKTADSPGVDFTLRTSSATFFKISGVALNPNAVPGPDGIIDRAFNQFLLVPVDANLLDSAVPSTFPNSTGNRTAGEFELRNVRPGMYELFPLPGFSGFLAGRTTVDVRNADAPGVRVPVNPGVPMQGRVVVAQASPQRPVKFDSIRILPRQLKVPPVRGSAAPLAASLNEGGQFTIGGPAGTMAMIQVSGLPDTAFVSDIQIGNTSVYDTGFELSSASEPLQVVIDSTSGGTVEATVRSDDGRAMPRATVALVPAEGRRQNPMRYKTGTTDNDGRVILRGVAPGTYTAFAWESVPETAWQNNEFLAKYQTQGMAVTIPPSAQVNLQLRGIPFDADLR